MVELTQEQIDKAILWFESMGYHAEQLFDAVRLECEGFSVILHSVEVEHRASQWDYEQQRND